METTAAGGINKTVRELASVLSARGHKVTVLQLNPFNLPPKEINSRFEIIRFNSVLLNNLYGLNYNICSYLISNFNLLNPDIVHLHGYQTLLLPEVLIILKYIIRTNTPIFLTPHYDPLNRSTFAGKKLGGIYDRLFGKLIFSIPDHIISISNFEKNIIERMFNRYHGVTVIPHGVGLIDRKKIKKSNNCINLLYAGYLLDYKGVQYIIKALHTLIYTLGRNDVRLTIIGEGAYKEQLVLMSKRLNVSDFITWKPFLSSNEVMKEMKQADIFLLLSKSEGYGIVVAEALAIGTPSIVTNGTALEEFTKEPGCFGVEYPPRPDVVARLIIKIYNDNINVGPFSDKIKIWENVIADYEKAYLEILHNSRQ